MNDVIDTIIHGDALEVLKSFPSDSISAIVCDPPCGISFMSRNWDGDKGGRDKWVKWLSDIMKEAKRCLLPGGHALVWALPRQSHWTALALEDAGFQIRDCLYNLVAGDTALLNFIASLSEEQQNAFMQLIDQQRESSGILHIFGAGFPKSHNISIAIDRLLGKEREIIGSKRSGIGRNGRNDYEVFHGSSDETLKHIPITAPATPEAAAYSGFGTNLKPAVENWWLVRKPLAAPSIAENVLTYGTGALNIDKCRIGTEDYTGRPVGQAVNAYQWGKHDNPIKGEITGGNPQGRFPSHLLLSHTVFCVQSGTKKVRGTAPLGFTGDSTKNAYGDYEHRSQVMHRDEDGMETVANWICPEFCPVRILDEQGGFRETHARGPKYEQAYYENGAQQYDKTPNGIYGDFKGNSKPYGSNSGFVSRYFKQLPALDDVPPYIYAGKASRKDRTADNTVHNTHPTVKSLTLSKYLVSLITPPNGIVLDCFCGSGSIPVAAIHEGFHFIGIEKEAEYVAIAQKRIEHALSTLDTQQPVKPAKPRKTQQQPSLFDKEDTA